MSLAIIPGQKKKIRYMQFLLPRGKPKFSFKKQFIETFIHIVPPRYTRFQVVKVAQPLTLNSSYKKSISNINPSTSCDNLLLQLQLSNRENGRNKNWETNFRWENGKPLLEVLNNAQIGTSTRLTNVRHEQLKFHKN